MNCSKRTLSNFWFSIRPLVSCFSCKFNDRHNSPFYSQAIRSFRHLPLIFEMRRNFCLSLCKRIMFKTPRSMRNLILNWSEDQQPVFETTKIQLKNNCNWQDQERKIVSLVWNTRMSIQLMEQNQDSKNDNSTQEYVSINHLNHQKTWRYWRHHGVHVVTSNWGKSTHMCSIHVQGYNDFVPTSNLTNSQSWHAYKNDSMPQKMTSRCFSCHSEVVNKDQLNTIF